MKKTKTKKILSGVLAIIMILSINIVVFADSKSNESITNDYIEISLKDLELNDGASVVFTVNKDGELIYQDPNSSISGKADEGIQTKGAGMVSVKIKKTGSNYYLNMSASGIQLKGVSGYMECKETDWLFPTSYHDEYFNVIGDGTLNKLYESSDTFSIPSDVEKVKVGWHDVTLHEIENSYDLGDRYSSVTLSKIK